MAELILDAYIPSKKEYDKYFDRLRAFMSADLSELAKKQGAYEDGAYKKGRYPLRTAFPNSTNRIYNGYYRGTSSWNVVSVFDNGIRVAIDLIYNPSLKVVQSRKKIERTAKVFDKISNTEKEVSSEASIVTFGGKEYIWCNEEECLNGKEGTMKCWSLDLPEKAVPFDKAKKNNDFGKAAELIAQIERIAKEGCSKEELDILIPVSMSDSDGYDKVNPSSNHRERKI